ncbi:Hypothetical protein DHA2_17102 [Giardia duodenalis]|uniref:Proteasome activator pa28 beta subunit n=1 Tax=Giardia intestinalis TaxID=5741 RepID=V6TRE8_GIAIN|nr:Hypothetical protein DHA2_17102 [Giardia intestinalis]
MSQRQDSEELASQVQKRLMALQVRFEEDVFVSIPAKISRIQTLLETSPYLQPAYITEFSANVATLLKSAYPTAENPAGDTKGLVKELSICPVTIIETQTLLTSEMNAVQRLIARIMFNLVYLGTRDEFRLESESIIDQATTQCGNLHSSITALLQRATHYQITRGAFVAKLKKTGLFDFAKSITEIDTSLLSQYAADLRTIQSGMHLAAYALVRLFRDQRARVGSE